LRVERIQFEDVSRVELGNLLADLVHSRHEPVVLGEMSIFESLMKNFGLDLLLHRLGAFITIAIGWMVPVDTTKQAAKRAGRDTVAVAGHDPAFGTGEGSKRCVARAVDKRLSLDETAPLDIGYDRAVD